MKRKIYENEIETLRKRNSRKKQYLFRSKTFYANEIVAITKPDHFYENEIVNMEYNVVVAVAYTMLLK